MFLMNYTIPDIAYTLSRLRRYTHNLEHWNALYRLLQYLIGTLYGCFQFNKFPTVLVGYCDANCF